jgi:hypothetical protein
MVGIDLGLAAYELGIQYISQISDPLDADVDLFRPINGPC